MENLKELFKKALVGQIRALDQFGSWDMKSDDELFTMKYIKTKEDLKSIPIIADIDDVQTKDIRLIFQALALAFETATGVMCNVVMEMSHEGFGRVVVIADKIVVVDKFFKDAHRFGYRTIEDLEIAGEKFLADGIKIYNSFKG
ncbi:MAG: NifX-associated nitrogen fixation protein [Arcobacteraceae bacterium]|nr:NifX-associated nitrogen fixation protein [Arcobacteraceae bacterium]